MTILAGPLYFDGSVVLKKATEMCESDSGESRDPLNRVNRAGLIAWKKFNGSRLSSG
jgi:hypothetical protein